MTTAKKQYIETIGRRKTSTARVRLHPATKTSYEINGKDLATYFPTSELQKVVSDPFAKLDGKHTFAVTVKVVGGGIHSQAEAVRLGVARALLKFDMTLRGTLKSEGYLKRDPRAVERKHFGLKKARRAPQWSKR